MTNNLKRALKSVPANEISDIISQLQVRLPKHLVVPYDIFTVRTNYDATLQELFYKGQYDRIVHAINHENYPSIETGSIERKIHLLHFHINMTSEDIIEAIDHLDMRPISIKELLCLRMLKILTASKPVIAFGAVNKDRTLVVGIQYSCEANSDDTGYRREVTLDEYHWNSGKWSTNYFFAATPKD